MLSCLLMELATVLSTDGADHYSVVELVLEVMQDYLSCLLVELVTTQWRSY